MARKKHNRRQDKAKKAIIKAAATEPGPRERREVITLNPAPELDLRPKTKWFVVFTGPRAEARAKAGLEEAGCSVFWPSSHKTVTVGKRITFDGDIATFARYLFASGPLLSQPDVEDAKPAHRMLVKGKPIVGVFDIDGIQGIVSDSKGWVRMPNIALQAIADYQMQVAPDKLPPPRAKFLAGEEVTIVEGPFMGFMAQVVEAVGLQSAKVIIRSFGNEVLATMPVAGLQAA